MNNQLNNISDPLRGFLGPGKEEKAPSGFTLRVMENIRMEATPQVQKGISRKISSIPAISLLVTVSLIIAALLIPEQKNDVYSELISESFRSIKITLPSIDLQSIFSSNLPEVMIWVLAGIIILTIFDRALKGLFQGQK